jgi:hypothetical protein
MLSKRVASEFAKWFGCNQGDYYRVNCKIMGVPLNMFSSFGNNIQPGSSDSMNA